MAAKIEPNYFIDSHIHLFNIRSLPIRGILEQVKILRSISKPLSDYLNAMADDFDIEKVDFINDEFNNLDENSSINDYSLAYTHRSANKLYALRETDDFAEFYNKKLKQSVLFNSLTLLQREYVSEKKEMSNVKLMFESDRFFREGIDVFLYNDFNETNAIKFIESQFKGVISWILNRFKMLAVRVVLNFLLNLHDSGNEMSVVIFLTSMLKNEALLFKQAERGYGVEPYLLVHYMIDMSASYRNGETYYKFHPEQTDHMMKLVNNSGGRLLGFTAYNPYNVDHLNSSIIGLEKGNIGIKFYPPMGYRATQNKNPLIEERVKNFFDIYREGNIPIFTHCTPVGFEVMEKSGLNSDPKYWEILLEQPGNSKLRICFGHAGGGGSKVDGKKYYGWYANKSNFNSDNCYAKKVIELCENYENVYCEIAHLEKIIGSNSNAIESRTNFTKNLKRNWDNKNSKYKLKDKICFGTDWHMLLMINNQKEYYDIMVNIFQDELLNKSIDNFFFKNFLKYLNIPYYLDKVESVNKKILKDIYNDALGADK